MVVVLLADMRVYVAFVGGDGVEVDVRQLGICRR